MPRSYCCAQFLARRDTIRAAGAAFWSRALMAMDESLPPGCEAVRPATGMHCLVYESIWHVMFGQPERLSTRAEDVNLPAFLRIQDTDSSDLPGGANHTMYFKLIVGEDVDVSWMDDLEERSRDLTGASSIGYSTLPQPAR